LNGKKIHDRVGKDDHYSYDQLPPIPRSCDPATMNFHILQDQEHQLEVNWPGPAVLLELGKKRRNF
jgi:hypothetical protein